MECRLFTIYLYYQYNNEKQSKENIMTAQQLLNTTNVFEYELGCFALEHNEGNIYINIAIDSEDKLVEFEVYVNEKAVVYSNTEKQEILEMLINEGENLQEQEEENEPFEPDWMDLAKDKKLYA